MLGDERNADLIRPTNWKRSANTSRGRGGGSARPPAKGLPVDLMPFPTKYREQFVLKPNDDYGGRASCSAGKRTPLAGKRP